MDLSCVKDVLLAPGTLQGLLHLVLPIAQLLESLGSTQRLVVLSHG